MPLPIIGSVISKYSIPTDTLAYVGLAIFTIAVVRAYAQGRSTSRDRDLHGRVILLTGAFTPMGSTLLEALASRGAHVIAVTDKPVSSEAVTLVIDALRETTRNEYIFAEYCNTLSTTSTREFCTKFLTSKETRLDAIIFAHEYEHVGPFFRQSKEEKEHAEERRAAASDCTFLMTTLLLPTLLVAPAERDIRIINIVNPFYAAAVPHFPTPSTSANSTFLREGYRSLRSIVLMRHLQRVFDALPQAPAPDPDTAAASVASNRVQKSNIVSVSVSPGFSRQDTVGPLLRANPSDSSFSIFGLVLYLILQPLLQIFLKSPYYTSQTVLHALFLPTPFKVASTSTEESASRRLLPSIEALKPGALYSDCSVVNVDLSRNLPEREKKEKVDAAFDDGEYGGHELGQFVWESFETSLKEREKREAGLKVSQAPEAPGSEADNKDS